MPLDQPRRFATPAAHAATKSARVRASLTICQLGSLGLGHLAAAPWALVSRVATLPALTARSLRTLGLGPLRGPDAARRSLSLRSRRRSDVGPLVLPLVFTGAELGNRAPRLVDHAARWRRGTLIGGVEDAAAVIVVVTDIACAITIGIRLIRN